MPERGGIAVSPFHESGHSAVDGGPAKTEMAKIPVAVPDAQAGPVVGIVRRFGRTGGRHPGDGAIRIRERVDAVRIAEGARGDATVTRHGFGG